jgi:hypothetical protein
MWLVKGIGNTIDSGAKLAWNGIENTVNVTGVGSVFEKVGIKVEEGVYEKGINYNVDNCLVSHEGKMKMSSKDGEFGANAKHEAKLNGIKVFTAQAVDTSVGLILTSRLNRMWTLEGFFSLFEQFDRINPAAQLEKVILESYGKNTKANLIFSI